MLEEHAELRAHVYGLLREGAVPKIELLASAVAEGVDPEGLLLLVALENKQKRPLISWRTIEGAVTDHIPSEHWKGAFDVVPIPSIELRSTLLSMTSDGREDDAAARVLTQIDQLRDDYGAPETEPRHPDLASGRPWPILRADSTLKED